VAHHNELDEFKRMLEDDSTNIGDANLASTSGTALQAQGSEMANADERSPTDAQSARCATTPPRIAEETNKPAPYPKARSQQQHRMVLCRSWPL